MDVDSDLSAEPGEAGRHPLPAPSGFERAARRAGIRRDGLVVAYDRGGAGGAARLWWLLRHFGHEGVSVLDGGIDAWVEAGGPIERGVADVPEGDFEARPRDDDAVTADVLLGPGGRRLVDVRAPERYRGEVEPVDSVAGHIPGAVNLPFAELAPGGSFLPPHLLRERLERAGAGPGAVVYCGSGVSACTIVLASVAAGIEGVLLYPGSWSEWSRRGLPASRSPPKES